MIAAYLTEEQIIEALLPGMPKRKAKLIFGMWTMHPAFPKVDKITGRRWMPAVEQWINRLHHVGAAKDFAPVALDPRKGERFAEICAEREAKRAAQAAKRAEWVAEREAKAKARAKARAKVQQATPPNPVEGT